MCITNIKPKQECGQDMHLQSRYANASKSNGKSQNHSLYRILPNTNLLYLVTYPIPLPPIPSFLPLQNISHSGGGRTGQLLGGFLCRGPGRVCLTPT